MRGDTQIATQFPDGATLAISGSTELELGARGMLLLADGAFRLDARPMGGESELLFRRLGVVELTVSNKAYVGAATGDWAPLELPRELRPRSFDFSVEIVDGARRRYADIVVGSFEIPERGTTRFTAQVILRDVGVD